MLRVASSAVLDARALLTSIVSKAVFNRVKPPDMFKFSMNAASARSGKIMVMGKSLSIHTNASKIHHARVMYEGLRKVSNINNIWPACARWPSNTDRSCSEPVWHLDSKIRYWLLQKKPHHEKLETRKKKWVPSPYSKLWTKRSTFYCHSFRSVQRVSLHKSCAARNNLTKSQAYSYDGNHVLRQFW